MRCSRAASLRRAFELAGRLLDAYAAIHERGVLHGDVHPRNALVLHDGSVRLIDFGLADSRVLAAELRPHDRGGVGFFLDPEFARARLDDRRPPRVDAAGEQYSIAALVVSRAHRFALSSLLAGEAGDASADRRGGSAHLPRCGYDPSPAVEAVLCRALAKDRAARFASVAEFAAAFRAATSADLRRPRHASDALTAASQTLFEALDREDTTGTQRSPHRRHR